MNAITAITSNPKTNYGKESLTRRTCTPYVITQTPIGLQDVKYNRNWMGAAATTAPVVRKSGKSMPWVWKLKRGVPDRRTDRITFPHILTICINAQSTSKAI